MKRDLQESGQVIILILLIGLLGLTVGLSILSRTLEDLRQTTEIDESARALAAAEAGAEVALQDLADLSGGYIATATETFDNKTSYSYTIDSEAPNFIAPDEPLPADEIYQVNLDGYTGGSLTLYWGLGEGEVSSPAAILLAFITGDPGSFGSPTYGIAKSAFDPEATRAANNNFETASVINGPHNFARKAYQWKVMVNVPAKTKLFRLKALYNPTSWALEPAVGASLPVQGFRVRSVGESVGGVQRVVEVFQAAAALPPIFDFALFAEENIEK